MVPAAGQQSMSTKKSSSAGADNNSSTSASLTSTSILTSTSAPTSTITPSAKKKPIKPRYKELCNGLNLDKGTVEEAWNAYSTTVEQVIIEGDHLHWLACAIYTCAANKIVEQQQQSTISATDANSITTTAPTISNNSSNSKDTTTVILTPNSATPTATTKRQHREREREKEREKELIKQQNDVLSLSTGVPLNKLLCLSKMNLGDFFSKMKKWLDITSQGKEIRTKLEKLERNFSVSVVVFKKYKEIFAQVFKPVSSKSKDDKTTNKSPERTRKSAASSRHIHEITTSDIYKFCWILYLNFKGIKSFAREDLLNSYYKLLACIDFCYANALVSKFSHDLLNTNFKGLPANFNAPDFKLLDPSKQSMCILQSLCNKWDDVVEVKEIRELWLKPYIESLVKGKILNLSNEHSHLGCFETNNFEINLAKLSKELDIIMLSSSDFDERIFMNEDPENELGEYITVKADIDKLNNERDSSNSATTTDTELDSQKPTLKNGGRFVPQTPLSNRNYLTNKTVHPSSPLANATQKVGDLHQMLSECTGEPTASLEDIFKLCTTNPRQSIMHRVEKLAERFVEAFVDDSSDEESINLGKTRISLARKLYFKVLESIIIREQKRLPTDRIGDSLASLLSHNIFHISLFACCVEIVLASHNATSKTFPWILEVYKDFGETRLYPFLFYKVIELVIREEDRLSRDIVKHLAFIEERVLESLVWESDSPLWTAIAAHGSIPSCQDVVLPPSNNEPNSFEMSPLTSLRRNEGIHSPMPVTGRYSINTSEGGARRRLFEQPGSESVPSNQQVIHVAFPRSVDGETRYVIGTLNTNLIDFETHAGRQDLDQTTTQVRLPVKANPVTLFFRKVYYLSQLRFRDLWNRLQINTPDLQRRIWTLFETQIRNHTNLLRDRHLDQMIMCATYAIIKVCRPDRSPKFFQEIMKVYRFQPQASIEVYRSVLLSKPPLKLLDEGPSKTVPNSPVTRSPSKRIASSPMRSGPQKASITAPSSLTSTETPQPKERGDLIEFYNSVYVNEVRSMMIRFARPDRDLNLSPLPKMNTNPASPWRRVSQQHSVYVSPLKPSSLPPSPGRQLSYSFQRSPSKDLRTINSMIHKHKVACKRILQDDDGENTKKPCISDVASRRINDIMNERRSSN